jgi:hypothetical protein
VSASWNAATQQAEGVSITAAYAGVVKLVSFTASAKVAAKCADGSAPTVTAAAGMLSFTAPAGVVCTIA